MKREASSSIGFCALAYRPQGAESAESSHSLILFFILRGKSKALRLLVAQDWRSLVLPRDREYIDELLKDFKVRAGADAESLLQQVSTLSVGPLVTHATGASLADHPELEILSRSFTDF